MTQICGEDRHARESMAKAAALMGVSRESVRKARIVQQLDQELSERVLAGEMTLESAYREAVGDDRKALYVQLPAWLDAELRAWAGEVGMSRQAVVRSLLEDFLCDVHTRKAATA